MSRAKIQGCRSWQWCELRSLFLREIGESNSWCHAWWHDANREKVKLGDWIFARPISIWAIHPIFIITGTSLFITSSRSSFSCLWGLRGANLREIRTWSLKSHMYDGHERHTCSWHRSFQAPEIWTQVEVVWWPWWCFLRRGPSNLILLSWPSWGSTALSPKQPYRLSSFLIDLCRARSRKRCSTQRWNHEVRPSHEQLHNL